MEKAVSTVYNDFLGSDERGSDSFLHPSPQIERKHKLNDMKAYIPAFPSHSCLSCVLSRALTDRRPCFRV